MTVRCAAPQTTMRSRDLTIRAESLPSDSSQRQKRRPASGSHCPSRITSVPSQKNANSSHVPPKHSGRIRRFHWIRHRDHVTIVSNRVKAFSINHLCTRSCQVLFFRYLCRPQCAFVSCGRQSWTRSPGTPRRRPLARR